MSVISLARAQTDPLHLFQFLCTKFRNVLARMQGVCLCARAENANCLDLGYRLGPRGAFKACWRVQSTGRWHDVLRFLGFQFTDAAFLTCSVGCSCSESYVSHHLLLHLFDFLVGKQRTR